MTQEEMKKARTWADLKAFASTLNEDQLSQPIRWWGDERGGSDASFGALEEDYINDGESYSPASSYGADMPDEEDIESTMPKGTPMIYVD